MVSMKDKVSDISKNYYKYLINLQNVNGVGFGNKHVNGKDTKEPCIHVLVEKKIKDINITSNNIIPKTYMGIKTDVIEVGVLKELGLQYDPFSKIRPLEGGYVINSGEALGTLGCIVTSSADFGLSGDSDDDSDSDYEDDGLYAPTQLEKHYYILSNNHVLTDNETVPIGAPIMQPGGLDYPNQYIVARLSTYIPLKAMINDSGPINYMDCALAKISNEGFVSNRIASFGKVKGISSPTVGEFIQKAGAFSGVTFGSVLTLNTTHTTKSSSGKMFLYQNQTIGFISAQSGDSGCVILDDFERVIGLAFAAGTSDSGIEILAFTDINSIILTLGIDVYTG